MKKKCPKCGSENIIKIVPAASLVVPEINEEVKKGKAKVSCGCIGGVCGVEYQCKACKHRWDYLTEGC